ncbi:MAG TPA: Dam family site-specific DNA-(adenine-N6)-methyltransferase [Vicinamibacterales bacterium]
MNTATAIDALRPPLKWAGGKRWQVPHLLPYWERHASSRLVEPFCGGLAVTLGLMPERALVNDINPHLVNFYRQVKRGLVVTIPMVHSEAAYYAARDRFNALIKSGDRETQEAALLFYYLNKTGFNGLCRFNASGGFNVPFGKYKSINYRADFLDYGEAFGLWDITCGDFAAVQLKPGDFVYADPPYDVEFTTYSAGGFGWKEQERAASWLAQHDGPVILANQATERIVALYERHGFTLHYVDAPRRISCTGDRSPAREIIATRNL